MTTTGVTYGGTGLTLLVGHTEAGGNARVEIWYLLAPASGTADIVVTQSAANAMVGGATSWTGVDQTTPFGPNATADGAPSRTTYATATDTSFTVPAGVTTITVKAWGAGGGGGGAHVADGGAGGGGGFTQSDISVTPGETLIIQVGGGGDGGAAPADGDGGDGGGGGAVINTGGGQGGDGGTSSGGSGGGGGGYSAVKRGSTYLVQAAGGGGGGGGSNAGSETGGAGGAGGGASGVSGSNAGAGAFGGGGGTPSSGGAGGSTQSGGTSGTDGVANGGGDGGTTSGSIGAGGGGGGSGRYGAGGGGGDDDGAGGGGGGSGLGDTLAAGSGRNAGNNGDADYAGNAGRGGGVGSAPSGDAGSGNPGRIVLIYQTPDATVDVTSASDEVVVDVVGARNAASLTVGAGQTQRWNLGVGVIDGGGSSESGAATVTMSWTLSDTFEWAIAGVSLKPTAGGACDALTVTTSDPAGQLWFNGTDTQVNVSASFQSGATPALSVTNDGSINCDVTIRLISSPGSNRSLKFNTTNNAPWPADAAKEVPLDPSSVTACSSIISGGTCDIWLWADYESAVVGQTLADVRVETI